MSIAEFSHWIVGLETASALHHMNQTESKKSPGGLGFPRHAARVHQVLKINISCAA